MRRFAAVVLAFAVAAPLAGCGKSDDQEATADGPAVTAETIATNDVTAIDAVTGEAANIAADVVLDANLLEEANGSANASGSAARPRQPSGAPAPARPRGNPPPEANDSAPAPEPQSNSAE